MVEPLRVGVIGCGAISGAYLRGAGLFGGIRIVACADVVREAAERKAQEFSVPQVLSVDELLNDRDIDLVLNLTVPNAHAQIALRALEAGKHTYSEKPLATTRDDGRRILETAQRRGLRVGCAPDTFMGAGIQTARKLIDGGAIGAPVAFTAFMMNRGHEHWHPGPQFYYEPGGGPMFDMGPYYLTALINFFGPIRRVSGMASIAIPQRIITSQPHAGKVIDVTTPDHVCGTIEFENGVVGTMIQTFATHHPTYDAQQPITVYGTEGTLKAPDPNTFDGPVAIRLADDPAWRDVPHAFPCGYGRSVGLANQAQAIRDNRPHRASGELGFAVLDAMQGFLESSASGIAHRSQASVERPAPMPMRGDLPPGELDDFA